MISMGIVTHLIVHCCWHVMGYARRSHGWNERIPTWVLKGRRLQKGSLRPDMETIYFLG
jgi:hypothetical protein